MTRYYTDLHPTEPDRSRWTVVHALRARAVRAPDRTFLIAPEEGRTWTYGQILADAERVAGGLRAGGAQTGDRVVVKAGLKDGDAVVSSGAFMLKSELILQNQAEEE